MTVLRFPQDVDLHDDNGEHIKPNPSDSAAFKARVRRHLTAHARKGSGAVELAAMVKEWNAADQMVADAETTRWEIRGGIMARAKVLHEREGVTLVELARRFGLNERSLRDYFEHGRPQKRNRPK